MTLIESIGRECAPVIPNFFKNLWVVTISLTTINELGVHVVKLFYKLFTHCLSQCITLATRKVCNFTREQHDLLLVDGNAVCILQVFFHTRKVVGNWLVTMFTGYEGRNILHRSRTVQRIHGDKVLKS